jgi:hypothetical protein
MIKDKKGKAGKGRSWMFFLREGGVRLGLVVEGEGGRPGLVMIQFLSSGKGSAPRTCC